MSNSNCEILNDVTKTLIDSQKGYEQACQLSDDSHRLQSEFQRRASERQQLVSEFQNQVRAYGGEPETDGGMSGSMHRGFTKFASVFQDDEKAAVSAIDDGEEHLAEEIEDKMKDNTLDGTTTALLQRALVSARAGERFADRLDG